MIFSEQLNQLAARAETALAPFFALLERGGAADLRAFAREQGMMVDAVVDKINTVAGDMLGDVLIEEVDGRLAIIEDYRDILIKEGVLEYGK